MLTPSPPVEGETLDGGKNISTDDSSEETEMTKDVSPAGASRSGNAPSSRITIVTHLLITRKKRIASIVIDAGKNATGLLEQLGKHV
ncbi:hypothetical protein TNCV_1739041 [Trichonephila clavipes]|nr:hypothetical protein TNCV_1739041 [Trichonephila clavipes]